MWTIHPDQIARAEQAHHADLLREAALERQLQAPEPASPALRSSWRTRLRQLRHQIAIAFHPPLRPR